MARKVTAAIRVGVSQCLLGARVRYDGGHKHDHIITDRLGRHFVLIPVCPESEVGMGTPREPVHLSGDPEAPRMIGTRTARDWTARMQRFARARLRRDDLSNLDGFILKKNSPSCGMMRVEVYREKGRPQRKGTGLFAGALLERFPRLPVEEEDRLRDPLLRENFVERVFGHHRLVQFLDGRWSRGKLVRFHTASRYLILSHSPGHYREMEQLVAAAKALRPADLRERYGALYMDALAVRTTPNKHARVLREILKCLETELHATDKRSVLAAIADYRAGLVPLAVPFTRLEHLVEKHDVARVRDQIYLDPDPPPVIMEP